MTKAALYLRVSTREQESLPDQERRARAWCEAKGWTVERVFEDRGISAWSGRDRPGWTALERAVDARDVDAVVVFQISRSARNVGRLHAFITKCQQADVTFASTSEGLDTSSAMGRMMVTVIGALAELESEIRSERTGAGLERVRLEGRWSGGRRPFGFRPNKEGRLVVDEAEAALIREAAERFLGGAGLRTIANDWNRRRIRTPRKGDRTRGGARNTGLWRATTLHDMLYSDRHAGTTMTRRDHARVVAKLDQQARQTTRRGEKYMLTGLLVCGVCGGRMVGRPDNGQPNYICNATGRVHLRIVGKVVEDVVTRRAPQASGPETEGVADPSGPLLAERDRIEAEMETLGESDLPEAVLRGRARRLQRDLEEVEKGIEELPAPVRGFSYLLDDVAEPTPNEWREIVETVVDRVEIGPAVAGGVRAPSSEARVRIVWRDGVRELPSSLPRSQSS